MWAPASGTTILLDDQRTLNLKHVPPAVVVAEVRAAVDRWTWRKVAQQLPCKRLFMGGVLTGIRRLLRPESPLTQLQQSCLIAIVTGATPTPPEIRILEDNRRMGIGKRIYKPKRRPLQTSSSTAVASRKGGNKGERKQSKTLGRSLISRVRKTLRKTSSHELEPGKTDSHETEARGGSRHEMPCMS